MRHLPLQRPLVSLDLETTGVNPRTDRIVEIAAIKLHPDARRETWKRRLNPQRPIPASATAVHGITDADVATAPTFAEIAFDLLRFLGDSDLVGFGLVRFDVPLLQEEFRRAGQSWNLAGVRIVDAQRIYHLREPRTLSAALRFYCGQEHAGAHGAEADALAVLDVLDGQFERYPDLERDLPTLDRLSQPTRNGEPLVDAGGKLKWQDGEVAIAFGQKSGTTLRELATKDPNYLRWMLNKDFSAEVKQRVRDALAGQFPPRPAAPPAAATAAAAPLSDELPL
ncbi:MAG: 3'-5' exonuclease [Lentisphaeria bacterium]|jgi:DNA polymerase-3 subunit epsilon